MQFNMGTACDPRITWYCFVNGNIRQLITAAIYNVYYSNFNVELESGIAMIISVELLVHNEQRLKACCMYSPLTNCSWLLHWSALDLAPDPSPLELYMILLTVLWKSLVTISSAPLSFVPGFFMRKFAQYLKADDNGETKNGDGFTLWDFSSQTS